MIENLPASAGDAVLIPGSGQSPGEGNGNPLQYSCLENSMDKGAWCTPVHGVSKSLTQLSNQYTRDTNSSCPEFVSSSQYKDVVFLLLSKKI